MITLAIHLPSLLLGVCLGMALLIAGTLAYGYFAATHHKDDKS